MKWTELNLPGAFEIGLEPHSDERGYFARSFCKKEFAAKGLETEFVQCSFSYNKDALTYRGMHFQAAPHEEIKIVSCVQGEAFDVLLDLRKDSPSYGQFATVSLSAEKRNAVYIPKGCAHGFMTIVADTTLYYQISEFYVPELARGVNGMDESLGIPWPARKGIVVSEKDQGLEKFDSKKDY